MSAKLTPKQEAFALAYIETGNASEAYRRVYDVSASTKADTVAVNASKLIADTKIALRVTALQQRAAAKAVLTRAWVLDRLMDNAAKAAAAGDFTASNKALELLGKTDEGGNAFTDKTENKTTIAATVMSRTVDAPPPETREEWLARRHREIALQNAATSPTAGNA